MKRVKRHKIKREKPETSSAFNAIKEEHDLAYYIHDRVELMHQVFSVLKAKDLRAMAPECVRRLSIDDLEELCTEELLGISSKRLLAVLDGAEPPSDTESSSQSSQELLETISLDSISSDEELLSQSSRKKKHKHKRRDSKAKKHKKKSTEEILEITEDNEKSKASRAGLTVLELLELQARARAIRAQLQQEQANKAPQEPVAETTAHVSTDSEVEIKEEQAEILEISSGDEKPTPQCLEKALASSAAKETEKTDKSPSKTTATNQELTTATTNDKGATKTTTTATEANKDKVTTKTKKKKEKIKKKDKSKDNTKEIEVDASNKKDSTPEDAPKADKPTAEPAKVTKRVNDLIITVPQASTRKIKLNRNKMTVSILNTAEKDNIVDVDNARSVETRENITESVKKISSVVSKLRNEPSAKIGEPAIKSVVRSAVNDKLSEERDKDKGKSKDRVKKKKKKEKRQSIDEDHDEITLQLSDSEKMDLLEDFDRKNYDKVSSSSSDSESSSDSSEDEKIRQDSTKDAIDEAIVVESTQSDDGNKEESEEKANDDDGKGDEANTVIGNDDAISNDVATLAEATVLADDRNLTAENVNEESKSSEKENIEKSPMKTGYISTENKTQKENVLEICEINDIPIQNDPDTVENETQSAKSDSSVESNKNDEVANVVDDKENKDDRTNDKEENNEKETNGKEEETNKEEEETNKEKGNTEINITNAATKSLEEDNAKEMSDGELSSNASSEVEALELKPEVVCISDEENPRKKKKKDKKSKKEKKKKSDFRESSDQNFYKETDLVNVEDYVDKKDIIIIEDNDDVLEILELSDDSSCYEVEGTTLSKEPTVEEIAALSAKIDEIEREEAIMEEKKSENDSTDTTDVEKENTGDVIEVNVTESLPDNQNDTENLDNMSWKERYLGSKKVKKVLTTSNILNALRKKNKQLKKKMEESKKIEQEIREQEEIPVETPKETELEEGSIEQYNTLEASTKYVAPVPGPEEVEAKRLEVERMKEEERLQKEAEVQKEIEIQVTGEMKKDAKQLLKMYKKLLKYNDIKKQKDPNKKKKKEVAATV